MKIYYHFDNDGRLSAAIAFNFYTEKEHMNPDEIELIEIFHERHDEIFNLNDIKAEETVLILDYSISPDEMKQLLNITSHVIWIDHHKSAIDTYNDVEFIQKIDGIRYSDKDNPKSGCLLTAEYYSKGTTFLENYADNKFIQRVSDWDTFAFRYNDTMSIFYYVYSIGNNIQTYIDTLLCDDYMEYYQVALIHGPIIDKYEKARKQNLTLAFYDMNINGYKAIVANTTEKSSLIFGDNFKNYDMGIVYKEKNGKYSYSFYTKYPERVDLLSIAKKYGGGGHAGACGFTVDRNILEDFRKEHK